MKKNKNHYLRKAHRYLGLCMGIQLIAWTASGLYFSWTDIDEIHGDPFLQKRAVSYSADQLGSPALLDSTLSVSSLELTSIDRRPYYWINDSLLVDAQSGARKNGISEAEARAIAKRHLKEKWPVRKTEYLTHTGNHHEFRDRKLPAWAIYFDHPEKPVVYIDASKGAFERIRHTRWRRFDVLWMLHTMDYVSRDNFNNGLLRVFSALGLVTVLSGLALYAATSKTTTKLFSR